MSALVADGQVEFAVEFGIGRAELAGVWDDATWDRNVWAQTDTELGDWVDVSCEVIDESVTLASGTEQADGVVSHWAAATCSLRVIGAQFNPWRGPYAGVLGPNMPVRMRWRPAGGTTLMDGLADELPDEEAGAGWLCVFVGSVDDAGYTWNPATDPARSTAALACTDDTSALAAFDGLEQNPQGAQESAAARVARILDMALWPAEQRAITPGGVPVQATTLAENAWTMLLQVADTDLALLWLRRDGMLAYLPEGRINPPRAVAAILVVCPDPARPEQVQMVTFEGGQPGIVRNIVSVSRQARDETDTPVTVTVRDEGSISRFRPHTYQRTDLIHWDDAWSTTLANAMLMGGAWPSNAPSKIVLSSRLGDLRAAQLLLGLDFDHMLQVADQTGQVWNMAPAGWSVNVNRREISGNLTVADLAGWLAGLWDAAVWDEDTWGL